MRDPEIRGAVKNTLLLPFFSDPNTLIVEELGLRHGAARVDIAVINGELHGYELKSDQDTLKRLPAQAATYNSVLDRITLILTPHHVDQATEMIPDWWGIILAEGQLEDEINLRTIRSGAKNPSVSAIAIARLLWRDEALQLLAELGAIDGMRSKPRTRIYSRIIELIALPQLQDSVRNQLKSRKDWRSAAQRRPCDG
jgi:hypothetical protein